MNPAGAENLDGSTGAFENPLVSVVISISEAEPEVFPEAGGVELDWVGSSCFFLRPKPPKPPNLPPRTLPRSVLGLDC